MAAIMAPEPGVAIFTHCTASVSAPTGGSVADTTGRPSEPPSVFRVESRQASEGNASNTPAMASLRACGDRLMTGPAW